MPIITNILPALSHDLARRADAALAALAAETAESIRAGFVASPAPPGSPPGVRTGRLRASIAWHRQAEARYTITDGVPYGVFLEYGTARMPARPFMTPAAADLAARAAALLRDRLA